MGTAAVVVAAVAPLGWEAGQRTWGLGLPSFSRKTDISGNADGNKSGNPSGSQCTGLFIRGKLCWVTTTKAGSATLSCSRTQPSLLVAAMCLQSLLFRLVQCQVLAPFGNGSEQQACHGDDAHVAQLSCFRLLQ